MIMIMMKKTNPTGEKDLTGGKRDLFIPRATFSRVWVSEAEINVHAKTARKTEYFTQISLCRGVALTIRLLGAVPFHSFPPDLSLEARATNAICCRTLCHDEGASLLDSSADGTSLWRERLAR